MRTRTRRAPYRYVPTCGACKQPAVLKLPVSGLMRCQACFDDLRGFCELVSDAHEPTQVLRIQPEIPGVRVNTPATQPFVTTRRLVSDFKRLAGGDA